jgi:hypothetical protein
MLLNIQVAMLARSIERKVRHNRRQEEEGGSLDVLDSPKTKISADDLSSFLKVADGGTGPEVVETEGLDALELIVENNGGSLNEAQKARISELLGRWDEPPRGSLGHGVSGRLSCAFISTKGSLLTLYFTYTIRTIHRLVPS